MTTPSATAVAETTTESDDSLAYASAGPLAAIGLGIALMPLRETMSASNLSFPFVILTIVVAAFGGRTAALTTALVSALSMDFFLTRPYLTLTMSSRHDVIAFVGLAACGLVAAALGSPERIVALHESRRHLALLHSSMAALEGGGPAETAILALLERACAALPVNALVVRDTQDRVVAASRGGHALGPIPSLQVTADLLLTPADRLPRRGLPLPTDGARLALRYGNRHVGWLDLWGNGMKASATSRRTLCDMARTWAVLLTRETSHLH